MDFIFAAVMPAGLFVLAPLIISNLARENELSGYRRRAREAAERNRKIKQMAERGGGRVVVDGQAYCRHGNVFLVGQGVYCNRCLQEGLDSMEVPGDRN